QQTSSAHPARLQTSRQELVVQADVQADFLVDHAEKLRLRRIHGADRQNEAVRNALTVRDVEQRPVLTRLLIVDVFVRQSYVHARLRLAERAEGQVAAVRECRDQAVGAFRL